VCAECENLLECEHPSCRVELSPLHYEKKIVLLFPLAAFFKNNFGNCFKVASIETKYSSVR
jgi:hypothetical protein